jgi:cytochrome c oxidase subunit 2
MPSLPNGASSIAGQVDLLFWTLVALSGLITLGVAGVIVYSVFRYRRRPGNEEGAPIRGSLRLEIAWAVVPLGLALVVFAWAARLYLDQAQPPPDALDVYVVAKQWLWKAQHVGGQQEINELHVPVGRPVRLILISQDVIHSFYVPPFRVKADVLPGRYTTLWFEAAAPGRYPLFCAEYCGTSHALMTGAVIALEPDEYERWLAGGATFSAAARGRQLFLQFGCNGCHRDDALQRAPSLVGLYGRPVRLQTGETVIADANYLRESVLNPAAKVVEGYQPIMPPFQGRISEEQLIDLIAYLEAIGPPAGGAPDPVPPLPAPLAPRSGR